MVSFIIASLAICAIVLIGMVSKDRLEKPRERRPDLSELISTPMTELEKWWQSEKSKDARIKELEELVAKKDNAIRRLNTIQPLRNSIGAEEISIGTLQGPSKIMIVPDKKISYYDHLAPSRVGLTFEGEVADSIMSDENTTHLTIRNGQVISWGSEEDLWL